MLHLRPQSMIGTSTSYRQKLEYFWKIAILFQLLADY